MRLQVKMPKITRTQSILIMLVSATLAGTGGLIAARNNSTQAQAPTPMPAMSGMDHSRMDHGMDLGPADANFDLRFIDAMIPHHQGAVVMAREILQKSKRPELRQLATAIIRAQEKEIAQMQQWRKAWYAQGPETPMAWHASMGHMMAMTSEQRQAMMMTMDLGPADQNFDLRFLEAMIPHHEGALTMVKAAQKGSRRPELQRLAQDILRSQQAEIRQMQQWRKAWYGK
jgi:uncharacterized protein (DUF305 family)